jgi:hypothetical protein
MKTTLARPHYAHFYLVKFTRCAGLHATHNFAVNLAAAPNFPIAGAILVRCGEINWPTLESSTASKNDVAGTPPTPPPVVNTPWCGRR